jgi:hypothetical protein
MKKMKWLYLSIGLLLHSPPEIIYDGKEYVTTYSLVAGTPFYKDGENSGKNVLVYDGVKYTDVPLWYDIRLDQLVTRRPDNGAQVVVVKERVDYFYLGEEKWVYLDGEFPGFYLALFESEKYQGYARFKKVLKDPKVVNEKRYFEESVEYLIRTPQSPHLQQVKKKNQLYALSPEHKKELKNLIGSGLKNDIPAVLNYLTTLPY